MEFCQSEKVGTLQNPFFALDANYKHKRKNKRIVWMDL